MITLTIDDKKVEVEEGSTILQAAEKLGITIPTLCHHKSLKPYGACRVCLVEIAGSRGSVIQASCVYPAHEGMVVRTDTERVLKTRRIMLELLLARCPDSERIKEMAILSPQDRWELIMRMTKLPGATISEAEARAIRDFYQDFWAWHRP